MTMPMTIGIYHTDTRVTESRRDTLEMLSGFGDVKLNRLIFNDHLPLRGVGLYQEIKLVINQH